MDTNKETRENTLKSEENSSDVSKVRTPLVDALRRYFGHGVKEEIIQIQKEYNAQRETMYEWGTRLGIV